MSIERWGIEVQGWLRKTGQLILVGWEDTRKTHQLLESKKLGKATAMANEELQRCFDDVVRNENESHNQPSATSSPHETKEVIFQGTGPSFAERMKRAKLGNTGEALGSHPAQPRSLQPFRYNFREIGGRGIGDTLGEPQDTWSTERISSTSTDRWARVASRSSGLFNLPEDSDTDMDTCTADLEYPHGPRGACNSCDHLIADRDRLKSELSSLRMKHDRLREEKADLQLVVNNVKWVVQEMDGLVPDGQITNTQMIQVVEDTRNRRVCYESWFPWVVKLYSTANAEEVAQIEAQVGVVSERRARRKRRRSVSRNSQSRLAWQG